MLGETRGHDGGADLTRRAVLPRELGERALDLFHPPDQRVVLSVAHEADAVRVIGETIRVDLRAQHFGLGAGGLKVQGLLGHMNSVEAAADNRLCRN